MVSPASPPLGRCLPSCCGQNPNVLKGRKNRIKGRDDEIAIMIPEEASLNFNCFEKNTDRSPRPYFGSSRSQVGIAEIPESTVHSCWVPEAGRIADAQFRIGFLLVVPAGESIRGGIAEDVVTVVPHTGRREDTIPEIELTACKSGMGTQNAINQASVVSPCCSRN